MVSLAPRAYRALDVGSKLFGLLLLAAALGGAAGVYAIPAAVFGVALGLLTVFIDVDD
ncbi:hypothetical protein [Salarchaeum sp. JOR-1]|uniref:hypothetical protein n=1 Tax=Salarchaeum sp. JOR-1 TaxID=2599399 RepID=UPI00143D61C6|nr:hypothetical protein [Salarchaeum sp. JOR-1]